MSFHRLDIFVAGGEGEFTLVLDGPLREPSRKDVAKCLEGILDAGARHCCVHFCNAGETNANAFSLLGAVVMTLTGGGVEVYVSGLELNQREFLISNRRIDPSQIFASFEEAKLARAHRIGEAG